MLFFVNCITFCGGAWHIALAPDAVSACQIEANPASSDMAKRAARSGN